MAIDVSLGRYRMTCDGKPSPYSGTYGVQFWQDGKIARFETWARCPTKEECLETMQRYIDYDNEHKKS